jgi:hypothetical protein
MDDGTQCPNVPVQGSQLCEQHANWLPADLVVYRAVTEHFRQDVREFWSRSNFYLIVQAGLLSVFVTASSQSSSQSRLLVAGLGILGFVIAIIWFLVARGSVMWIRRWRAQTIEIDNIVDRHHAYTNVEALAEHRPLMNPSNLTQYLPLVFCVGWIALLALLLW